MGLSCVVRVPGLLFAIAAALACPGLAAQSQPQSATVAGATAPPLPARAPAQLDALAVAVSPRANRAVSFTNHRSAFYYTQTHVNDHPEHAWFRGFNIAGRRMFSDYRLTVDGVALDPASARSVVVRPDALVRTYPNGVVETLRLYDDRDVVSVEVQGSAGSAALSLAGETVRPDDVVDGIQYYTVIGEAPAVPAMTVVVMRHADLFLICAGTTRDAARDLCTRSSAGRAGMACRPACSARTHDQRVAVRAHGRCCIDRVAALDRAHDGATADAAARRRHLRRVAVVSGVLGA